MFIGRCTSRTLVRRAWTSAHFRNFPRFSCLLLNFHPVPFWVVFTPNTALIFINNATEKLGVL